jgi:uncharacterized protein with HEPN domain
MLSEKRRIQCLRDIIKNCEDVQTFLSGITREQFSADLKTVNAVMYSIQTVGEAAIRLDKEEKRNGTAGDLENRYPHIEWRDLRGMSNFIRHQYDKIKLDLIWKTAVESLLPMVTMAKQEIARLEGSMEETSEDANEKPPSP